MQNWFNAERVKDPLTYVIVLNITIVLAHSLTKLFKCKYKWRHFRYYALILEGQIWRYRTRVGRYATSTGDASGPTNTFAHELKVRRVLSQAVHDALECVCDPQWVTIRTCLHFASHGIG